VPSLPGQERFLPALSDLVADKPSPLEVLPAVDRTLHFRATARDNHAGGGGVSFVLTAVDISGAALQITSPTGNEVYECGDNISVLWNPGGSTVHNMDVGFDTFDPDWSSGLFVGTTANNGSYTFRLPIATAHARISLDPNPTSCYFAYSEKFTVVDTTNPKLTAPANVTAECSAPNGTVVNLGNAVVSDSCEGNIQAENDAPSLFPLGTTYLMWTATDRAGNFDIDLQDVTVQDTTPPVLVPPPNVTVECASAGGTPVNLGTAKVSDACDASVIPTNDAPALFPVGSTTVHWTAADDTGNKATATNVVTVRDTIAPTMSCNAPRTITPSSVPVSFTGAATDICKGPLPVTISGYECYGFTRSGRRITKQCTVQLQGSKITILDSGGIGANIDWTIFSDDGSGNQTTQKCHIGVVKNH
jgi:hypothetical protein